MRPELVVEAFSLKNCRNGYLQKVYNNIISEMGCGGMKFTNSNIETAVFPSNYSKVDTPLYSIANKTHKRDSRILEPHADI